LFAIMGISNQVMAECIVKNGDNSGTESLRSYLEIIQDLSNGTCREGDNNTYRIKFAIDSNGDLNTDWDTIQLESPLSITNTQRTMTIGNDTITIGVNGFGMGSCIFSVAEGVHITFKNLTFYTDTGITTVNDAICGSWINGGNVTVEPTASSDDDGDSGTDDGGNGGIIFPPVTIQFGNIDWDGDGYTRNEGDCAITDPSINPGVAETCDGIDNNCDGNIDENFATSLTIFYPDFDGDGYGDASATADEQIQACAQPVFYSLTNDDCDDSNASINLGSTNSECDGTDYNCDATIDDAVAECITDNDGDGYPATDDCDDSDVAVNPGVAEIVGNGVDDNCDGLSSDLVIATAVTTGVDSTTDGSTNTPVVVPTTDSSTDSTPAIDDLGSVGGGGCSLVSPIGAESDILQKSKKSCHGYEYFVLALAGLVLARVSI